MDSNETLEGETKSVFKGTNMIAEYRLYFMCELADRMILKSNGEIVEELSAEKIKSLTIAESKNVVIAP